MARLYLTLQGKGGVGKSYLTSAFAQWLIDRQQEVVCVDTDTLNPTLLQYKPLHATHLKLSTNHIIDPRALDALISIVNTAGDAHVVVDVGSNGFETLMSYAVENELFGLLDELGHEVILQTVIAGGVDAEETLKGTMALLKATTVPIVLWLNEHQGALEYQGQAIGEAKFLKAASERILGPVVMQARTRATFGKDVEDMLRQRLTFAEAISRFDLMPRSRLMQVRKSLWDQLDKLGLLAMSAAV